MRYIVVVTDLYGHHVSYHDAGTHLALAQQLAAEIRNDRIEEGFCDVERWQDYRHMRRHNDEISIGIERSGVWN